MRLIVASGALAHPLLVAIDVAQVDYVLGNNGYDRSFIVGWGKSPPVRPHHKNAYGKDEWFHGASTPLYSLAGALVGGPHTNYYSDAHLTSPPGYQDSMGDYICNEVTIDYSAGLLGALAAISISGHRGDGGGNNSTADWTGGNSSDCASTCSRGGGIRGRRPKF